MGLCQKEADLPEMELLIIQDKRAFELRTCPVCLVYTNRHHLSAAQPSWANSASQSGAVKFNHLP